MSVQIKTRKQLNFYIQADRMMNRGCFKTSISRRLLDYFYKDYIMSYLVALRKYSYYINNRSIINIIPYIYWRCKHKKLGLRLGFSIEPNVLGYGVSIPHYGTIVVGG